MYDTSRTTQQIMRLLADAPARLATLTQGLSAQQLLASPEPGEWSARDVLAHLRSCADMWGKYMVIMLNEDRPTIKAIHPTTWIKQTDYLEQAFQPAWQAFTAQRTDLLAVLSPLAPEAWSRAAMMTGAGKPRERTVYSYALKLANHEQSHYRAMEHIAQTVSRL